MRVDAGCTDGMIKRLIYIKKKVQSCDLKITSVPDIRRDDKVLIGAGIPLALAIKTSCDQPLNFHINWGDNHDDHMTHSTCGNPKSVKKLHTYNDPGQHKIFAVAENSIFSTNASLNVEVNQCMPPFVQINGYFLESTVDITVTETHTFKGNYSLVGEDCKSLLITPFISLKWNVMDAAESEVKSVTNVNKLIFQLEADQGTFSTGKYSIVLQMQWEFDGGTITASSTGSFNIVGENVKAVISNGNKIVIPFHTLKSDAYEFIIDGRKSFDPNDMMSLINGMKYSWYCKSLNTKNNFLNNTRKHCSKSEMQELRTGHKDKSTLTLNTNDFEAGTSYELRMAVSKGNRQDNTSIIIQNSQEDAPFIHIMYVSPYCFFGVAIYSNEEIIIW